MTPKDAALFRSHLEIDLVARPAAQVRAQVDGVERFLSLEPRARVLDLGCGRGSQTIELARRGYRVLGMDADERTLAHGRAAAKDEKVYVHFTKNDPRQIPYRG